jgi:hypothetical protein
MNIKFPIQVRLTTCVTGTMSHLIPTRHGMVKREYRYGIPNEMYINRSTLTGKLRVGRAKDDNTVGQIW